MAVSAVLGAISAGTTALSGGALLGGFLVGGAGTVFTHFLVSTAMGAALNALSPKPSTSGTKGYSISGENGSNLDHQIIYGKARVGGVRIYDESTGATNKVLHRIIAFAGHEIDSFQNIYINDEIATLDGSGNVTSPARYDGFLRIKKHLGSPTQTADTDLISESSFWTSNHKLNEIAYLYVKMTYDVNAFPNGVPVISAMIKGKKVYDPRTSTTAWSDNPALCVRDYLSSSFGLNQSSTKLSTVFNTAADICDQTVVSSIRYTCNGAFVTSASPGTILSNLLTSCGGILWYSQGFWRMRAAAWDAATVSMNEDDVRGPMTISTRNSRRDNFNKIKGTFKGDETSWQDADYPYVTDVAFLTADNNIENVTDFNLPFTDNSAEAQRIAKIALFRNREQLTVSGNFGLTAAKLQVGDNVNLTLSRFGWVSKPFEVVSWNMTVTEGLDIQFPLSLRETSSQIFDDVPGSVFESNNSNLPNPYYAPDVGVMVSSSVSIRNETVVDVTSMLVSCPDSALVSYVETQFKKSSDAIWTSLGTGSLGVYEMIRADTSSYDFRARSVNFFDVSGNWIYYLNYTQNGFASPPQDVTNFRANLHGPTISLEWDPVPDLDLSHYKIRHALEETGASYANSTSAVTRVSRPATSVIVPARPGTYTIKAYDKFGNASVSYPSAVIKATALEAFTTTLTRTESTTFTGTKTNCSVTSGTLGLTSFGTGPSTGNYVFSTYIDSGAVRRVRSRINVNVARFDTSSGLWDSIPGLWDSIPGLFDDFTGAVQIADTDIVCYISTTDTDPSLTPVWTPYQIFKSGEFYARAFRFKIDLNSDSNNITPSISGLSAIVQY